MPSALRTVERLGADQIGSSQPTGPGSRLDRDLDPVLVLFEFHEPRREFDGDVR
jgi:hypothetical protein